MPVEDPGILTGLVPVLQRGGYFFNMPSDFAWRLRRTSDLEQKSSFMERH